MQQTSYNPSIYLGIELDKLSGQGVMKIQTYQLTETNKRSMAQLEIL